MSGSGKVEVTDGDVFAMPVFGPISDILNAILPGSGYSVARKATASFTIKDGIIHTDDFETAGTLFSMLGHGDIHFLDDKLDFELRMSAHGPGVLLTPMYKLFEYTGEGSLKKPNWHPKRFSLYVERSRDDFRFSIEGTPRACATDSDSHRDRKWQILLGAHMSIGGGVHMAIERACSIDCTAMQIFVKNNMQWFARPLMREEISRLSQSHAARRAAVDLRAR